MSASETDRLELTVIKCLSKGQWDDLFKSFGFDKSKIV
jgi:hypothetical protein